MLYLPNVGSEGAVYKMASDVSELEHSLSLVLMCEHLKPHLPQVAVRLQ